MSKPETMMIDDVKYIHEDAVEPTVVNFTGEESVSTLMIGKNVISRSRNAGIIVGTVVAADATGVMLKNARRAWYHKPKDPSVSWYEGVAVSGCSDNTKMSPTVPSKTIIEDYELTELTDEAYKTLMEIKPHAQK